MCSAPVGVMGLPVSWTAESINVLCFVLDASLIARSSRRQACTAELQLDRSAAGWSAARWHSSLVLTIYHFILCCVVEPAPAAVQEKDEPRRPKTVFKRRSQPQHFLT